MDVYLLSFFHNFFKNFLIIIFIYPAKHIKDILYFLSSFKIIFSKFLLLVLMIKYGIEFFLAYKMIPFAKLLLQITRLILIGKFIISRIIN